SVSARCRPRVRERTRHARGHRQGHDARMRLSDVAFHAARLRRPRHDLLHREHHVRGVPRAGIRAAAAAEADGARRLPRTQNGQGFLQVRSLKYEVRSTKYNKTQRTQRSHRITLLCDLCKLGVLLRTSYFRLAIIFLAFSLYSVSSGIQSGSGGASMTACSSRRASSFRPSSRNSSARKRCESVLFGSYFSDARRCSSASLRLPPKSRGTLAYQRPSARSAEPA